MMQIYLASQSPRRAELLQQIGQPFIVLPASLDETVQAAEAPADYVRRLALAKARAVWALPARVLDIPVLAADTSVVVADRILGKPENLADFLQMGALLSARSHQVLTGLCLKFEEQECLEVVSTTVWMRAVSAQEWRANWDSGEPRDKAGGYAIQGRAARYITRIDGSYSNVVGLPLHAVDAMLKPFVSGQSS